MGQTSTAPIYCYWGKTHGDEYHLLIYHALDVAAVGMVWWDACPAIRRAFVQAFHIEESEIGKLRARVLFFLALHDLGKLDVRFQLKAPDTLRRLWQQLDLADIGEAKGAISGFDHGASGFDWAIRECIDWFGEIESPEDLGDCWQLWLAAVTGHHGDLSSRDPDFCAPQAEDAVIEHDRQARRDFVDAMADLFLEPDGLGLTSPVPTCETAAQHLLAGFCSVCDWIGSNSDVMPYVMPNPTGSLADHVSERVRKLQAEQWLERFGLIGSTRAYRGLTALLKPEEEAPRGIQVLVDDWPLAPGLTLIEAPTGSGKTEAALAYAWRLLESRTVDSAIFALPTQATANAMLARAEDFAAKAFAGDAANIVLAHGKRWFHPGFKQLLAAGQQPAAQGKQEATRQCATWLAQSRKRVFLGQVGICTVDQVLLSVLPVRHQFVRGFGINKSVLIVDEVHAYDRYMHGLLAEVLRRQKAAGGNAVLLSATLPSGVRDRLLQAWQATGDEQAPYPAVWCATHGPVTPGVVPEQQRPPRREVVTELFKLPGAFPDDALLDRLIAAGLAGARVAVVLNLVDDAQRLAKLLRGRTTLTVDLFHARYRFDDRQRKETVALQQYGRQATRESGRILVATQVVEQSLDLDFDWLVTQICPVDLLFQRLGRLHRHKRFRSVGFKTPRCAVLSVEGDDYGIHKLIYGNTRVLWRTERLLAQTDQIEFPDAYRGWIEPVYREDDWDGEPEAAIKDYCDFLGKQDAAAWNAKSIISEERKPYDDNPSITVATRDGEMSLTVLPVQTDGRLLDNSNIDAMDDGQRAEAVNLGTIPVPHSWGKSALLGCPQDDEGRYRLVFVADGAGAWASRLGKHIFRYTEDFGLERGAGTQPPTL